MTVVATRDRILDAFESLLLDQGELAATLDAVASLAGVSKGGLLYHFGSKQALVSGQLERLELLAAEDVERIRAAPDGAVSYFVRTSVNTGSAFERAFIAASCLAQGDHPAANDVLATLRVQWLAVIQEAVGDPDVAEVIVLVSDGLYYNAALSLVAGSTPDPGTAESEQQLERLLGVLNRLIA